MASSVVMPVSANEHHRRLLASQSSPNLRYHASAPSSSTAWTGPGFIGGSSSIDEADAVLSENVEQIRFISSPLRSEVHKRPSAVGTFTTMSFGTQSTDSVASMSPSHSRSVSSFSSVGDSDLDSFPSPPSHTLTFGFAHSRRSSISDCGIIDGAAEEDIVVPLGFTPQVLFPAEAARGLSSHQRPQSNASSNPGQHIESALNNMHSRMISNATTLKPDPKSFTTIPVVARKHTKGLSFLSFTSSDDSHAPLLPPEVEGISTSSHYNLDLTPQKEVSDDPQPVPRPAPIRKEVSPGIHLSSFTSRRSLNPKFKGRKMLTLLRSPPRALDLEATRSPPPTSPLPFPPSPSSSSSQCFPITPVSPFSSMGMLAPPSPTWARSRNDKAVRILGLDAEPLSAGGRFDDRLYNSASTLDLSVSYKEPLPSPIQSLNKSDASFLGFDGDDPTFTPSSPSSPSFSRRSLKAMSLLGVREPPLVGRPRLQKSASLLGFGVLGDTTGMGEPGGMMQDNLDLHMDTTLDFEGSTVRGTLKTSGAMKKLWKNLTGTGGREAGKETGGRA